MSEQSAIKKILLKATRLGHRIFRNNTAKGWAGKSYKFTRHQVINVEPGDVIVKKGYPIEAGLVKGSSDLIGWTNVIVTDQMVGSALPVFTAIEVKYGSTRTTKDQMIFIDNIKNMNGIAGIVYNEEDYTKELELWLKNFTSTQKKQVK